MAERDADAGIHPERAQDAAGIVIGAPDMGTNTGLVQAFNHLCLIVPFYAKTHQPFTGRVVRPPNDLDPFD